MAHDDTRGRRGSEGRGGRDDHPRGGYQHRDRDARGGQFGRDRFEQGSGPRDRAPWRGAGGEQHGERPVRLPFPRPDDRPAFQSRERDSEQADQGFRREREDSGERREFNQDRPPFRGAPREDRPPFRDEGDRRPAFRDDGERRPSFQGDRPPFQGDRPPFQGDRPPFRNDRGEGGKPWYRENRSDSRPPYQDRGSAPRSDERPTYRQGRGGYRSFDQDLGRPRFQDRSGGGDRPYQGRRPDGDRPPFQERRPFSGGRPFERSERGESFESAGRPLGTSTRAGRSPVSQFERIQADVYGRWPVLESLRAGNVTKVYLAAGVKDSADHLQEIQTIAAEKHITVVRVDRFDLDGVLGNVNHQGIAAACRPFHFASFDEVLEAAKRSSEKPLVLLCDGVQDPQNLGSILRTAEAVGVDGAVLPKHHQAGVTPAVVRASAGAVEHLPIAEVTNLRQSIATLKEAGYWIVGLDMDGGTDYDNFDVDSPVALIVGGEGSGVSRMVREECDYLVRLPMRGKISSLNASVAAGIVLYEIGRRRGTVHTPKVTKPDPEKAARAAVKDAVAERDEIEVDEADYEIAEHAAPHHAQVDDLDELEDDEEFLPEDLVEGDEIAIVQEDEEDLDEDDELAELDEDDEDEDEGDLEAASGEADLVEQDAEPEQ